MRKLRKLIFYSLLAGIVSCQQENTKTVNQPVLLDSVAQNPLRSTDQSPMDMSYYPEHYPVMKMEGRAKEPPVARVIYSRPHKKGREIFGNSSKSLVQYGKEWRLGANEATEIEFFREVYINHSKVEKGRYIVYCIPYPEKWVFVFNSNLFAWGLHMDPTQDILRVELPVQKTENKVEDFTMVFQPAKYGTDLLMVWDNVQVTLPISFSP